MNFVSGFFKAEKFQKYCWLATVFLLLFLAAHPALASNTNGGGMPYESWLTTITNSVTGPVAYVISVIALVGTGAGLIFGGDMNGFLRALIFIVLVISFIIAAKNTLTVITGQGAEITAFHCHVRRV